MKPRFKAEYQRWNEDEFAGDLYVTAMTPVQRWIYRTLLQKAFVHSTRPYLPDDDRLLSLLSGCENLEQWVANAPVIRSMFQPFTQDGVSLLRHKRVEADWNFLCDKRAALAEAGALGGRTTQARAFATAHGVANGQPSQLVSKSVSQGVSEPIGADCAPALTPELALRSSEQNIRQPVPKTVTPEAALEDTALQYLGTAEERTLWRKSLHALVRIHGLAAVVANFTIWAQQQTRGSHRRPISAYLRVADRLMAEGAVSSNPVDQAALQTVFDEIALLSDNAVVFNASQRASMAQIVAEYGGTDVVAAFREFWPTLDDHSRKFAALDFVQKAAQFCRTEQTRNRQRTTAAAQASGQADKMRQQVQAELARAENEQADEGLG